MSCPRDCVSVNALSQGLGLSSLTTPLALALSFSAPFSVSPSHRTGMCCVRALLRGRLETEQKQEQTKALLNFLWGVVLWSGSFLKLYHFGPAVGLFTAQ